jgi:hypothetical protein
MGSRNPASDMIGKHIRRHLTAVGIAQMVFNFLWICGETISFFVLRARNLNADSAYIPRIPTHTLIFTSIVIMLNILGIAGGYGVLKERNWAWRAVIIVSVIELFGFPVGTIIGIYSLRILFNKGVKELFRKQSRTETVYPTR